MCRNWRTAVRVAPLAGRRVRRPRRYIPPRLLLRASARPASWECGRGASRRVTLGRRTASCGARDVRRALQCLHRRTMSRRPRPGVPFVQQRGGCAHASMRGSVTPGRVPGARHPGPEALPQRPSSTRGVVADRPARRKHRVFVVRGAWVLGRGDPAARRYPAACGLAEDQRGALPRLGHALYRVHGTSVRQPADLLPRSRGVRLALHVRRFACREPACRRRTFAERKCHDAARAERSPPAREGGRRVAGRRLVVCAARPLVNAVRQAEPRFLPAVRMWRPPAPRVGPAPVRQPCLEWRGTSDSEHADGAPSPAGRASQCPRTQKPMRFCVT